MLATLMEPSKAHKVFPCFDHPTKKAVFQLTLIHPTNAKVVHNTFAENLTEIRYIFGWCIIAVNYTLILVIN